MGKYRFVDTKDKDLTDLNRYMEKIENPPSSPPTKSIGKSFITDTGIKTITIAGVLAMSNLVNMLESDHVKFRNPTFSEANLEDYNRNIEKPFNDYINTLSKLTSHKVNMTRDEVVNRVTSFKFLNQSWDGYGAIPLEAKSTANAIRFIYFLNDRIVEGINDVYPTPNGTVSFVWENENDERLNLEIGNNTLSYYVKLNSQEPVFFNNIEINANEANTISDSIEAI